MNLPAPVSPFTLRGHTFRDIRTVKPRVRALVRDMLAQEAQQYPPELYCKGGTVGQDEVRRLMVDRGLTIEDRAEAIALREQLEAKRHPVSDYFGDIRPVTFSIRNDASRDLVAAWQLWSIRTLPAHTEQDAVVRARPFPAYPGIPANQLVKVVLDLMLYQLGRKLPRQDGGTLEVREWESFHFRSTGGRGDAALALFESEYLAREIDGVRVRVTDDTFGRKVWRVSRDS